MAKESISGMNLTFSYDFYQYSKPDNLIIGFANLKK